MANDIKKTNWKKIGMILLIIFAIISVVGIIFSSLAFAKNIKGNNSKDIGEELQLTYNITLNENKSPESQMEENANLFYNQLKSSNLNEFDIKYGIENTPNNLKYGTIVLELSVNDPGLNYDIDLSLDKYDSKEVKANKTQAINQHFGLFYRFAHSFNLALSNINAIMNNGSSTTNENFIGNSYQINKNDNTTLNTKTNKIEIALDKSKIANSTYDGNWDLSPLQEQFVKVVNVPVKSNDTESGTTRTDSTTYWDQADYENEKAANDFLSANAFTEAPKNSYIIWNGRSELIYRLQLSGLAAYLYENLNNFDYGSKEFFIAENLINSLTIYEKDFGYWVYNNQSYFSNLSNKTINNNINSETYDPNQDPLLKILDDYYKERGISFPVYTSEEKTTIEDYKQKNSSLVKTEKKFLYSWNLSENPLISNSFTTIDYANFWKFFASNNDEWNKDADKKEFNSKNYFTKTFNPQSNLIPRGIQLDKYVDLLNVAKTPIIIFNQDLTNNYDSSFFGNNKTQINNNLKNFTNSLSVFNQQSLNSIITLPTYISAFIGILVIILIIGIVVSILYRIPGLIAAVSTTLAFTLSCLFYTSLGLSFSFGTYLLLAAIAILVYIPIIYLLDYFKQGIWKGYNLNNSLKYSIRKYIKVTCGIYITLLIFGLVFLFFGYLQIQSFGTILTISSLMGILFNGVIYVLVVWWFNACLEKKYNLIFSKKYVDKLILSQQQSFDTIHNDDFKPNSSIIEKMCQGINLKTTHKNWLLWLVVIIGLVAIAGLVLLLVLGPGFSLNFSKGTIIYLETTTELTNAQINEIVNALNMNLFDVKINSNNNFIQTILIFNNAANWTQLQATLTSLATSLNIKNFFISQNEIQTFLDLNQNVINCIFIALGFIAIWSLLWLNVVNIIPMFLLQLINILVLVGVIGITRIPFSINSLYASLTNIVFFSTLVFGMFTNLKTNFKKEYTTTELLDYTVNETKLNFSKYNFALLSYILTNLLFIIFVSDIFMFAMLLIACTAIFLYFVNHYCVPTLFTFGMWIKKIFSKERYKVSIKKYVHNLDTGSQGKSKDFDKVDEQEIYGLNKFRTKEIH